ncbi:MAG: nicotinate (nicotinamide) nucleotide adenylyltransferase [Planctomycetes bacterium]|nr:nicotinate (nicotinamide) nucleotide adenylyltransferase [Planctomycetota bacterium]
MAAPASPPVAPHERPGLAVLGGSFNPPHATHRRLAEAALAGLPVDRVLVIPAGDHPHKRNSDMAPAEDRLAMCRLAFADLPEVTVDDRELRRTGPSFTVDTLASLRREHPGRRLYFLIGSDNLPLLPTWREPERLLTLCEVVTYPRLGHPLDDAAFAALPLPAELRKRLRDHVLELPADAIAASELRRRWRAGQQDLAELHPEVRAYIRAHHLYR